MNLIVCFLVVLYFSDTDGGGHKGSKHDILKIHVPEIINHKHHTHYVFIHKHAPKKAPKKKEVKHHHHKHIHLPGHGHHHHKHWFGVHKAHGHKHTTGHAKPVLKVLTVHKTPHPTGHKHVHKTHGHKPHPVLKKNPAPKHHHPKIHHQPTYPFTHENIRYSPGPASPGYQVTEEYDPEEEVYKDFHPNDYSIPGELSSPPVTSDYIPNNQYPPTAGDVPKVYNTGYFTYPTTYGHYTSPGLSSYDISPYHTAGTPQTPSQQVVSTQEPSDVTTYPEDDAQGYTYNEVPVQSDAYQGDSYQGDYQFDYDPHTENDFNFQHNGYDHAHPGHVSEEFGENVPGYTQHHKQFAKDINHGVVTKAYDDRLQHFTAGDAADKDAETVGFQQSFSHGGHYTSIA